MHARLIKRLGKSILIERQVIDSILSYAQMLHPREAVLLLKGRVNEHGIVINDTQIPPLATHGSTFSTFPLHMLPIDYSIVGVAHSHPSGVLIPSITDLNKFYGRIMALAAYPYRSEKNIALFDREGNALEFDVI